MKFTEEENAQNEIINYLSKDSGLSTFKIRKDYDVYSKKYGLSGNYVSDLAQLNNGQLEKEKRNREIVIKGMYRMGYEKPLEPDTYRDVKNSFDLGMWDDGAGAITEGTVDLLTMIQDSAIDSANWIRDKAGLEEAKGRVPTIGSVYKDIVVEAREATRKNNPVSKKFANSLAGQTTRGFGQAGLTIPTYLINPTVGVSTSFPQAYQFGYDRYRDYTEEKGIEFDESLAREAGLWNMPSASLDIIGDRFVVGKILKPLKGTNPTKSQVSELVKDGILSFGVGGSTEGAQTTWENFNAKYLAGYDEDAKLSDGVLTSMIIGGIVDSTISTGGNVASKGINALTPESVKKARAKSKLDTRFHPKDGLTDQDMAVSKNVYTDEEFNEWATEKFGDAKTEEGELLSDLAKLSREGNKEARVKLIKSTTLDVKELFPILTNEELKTTAEDVKAARHQVENEPSIVEKRIIDKEFKEASKPEENQSQSSVNFNINSTVETIHSEKTDEEILNDFEKEVTEEIGERLGLEPTEGSRSKLSKAHRSMGKAFLIKEDIIDDLKREASAVLPEITIDDKRHISSRTLQEEIDEMFGDDYVKAQEFENSVKQAYEADTGIDITDVRAKDINVKGNARLDSSETNSEGIIRLKGVATVYRDGYSETFIEEITETKIQLDLANNVITEDQIDGWINEIQKNTTDEVMLNLDVESASTKDKIEWLSSRAVEWWSTKNKQNSKGLSETLIEYLKLLADFLGSVVNRGNILRKMDEKGVLPQEFKNTIDVLYKSDVSLRPTPTVESHPEITSENFFEYFTEPKLQKGDPEVGMPDYYQFDLKKMPTKGDNSKLVVGSTYADMSLIYEFGIPVPNQYILENQHEMIRDEYGDVIDPQAESESVDENDIITDQDGDGYIGGERTYSIDAFHGSPYLFRVLDYDKIGTGHGFQVHGYGLYVTNRQSKANAYRVGRFAYKFFDKDGNRVHEPKPNADVKLANAFSYLSRGSGEYDRALQLVQDDVEIHLSAPTTTDLQAARILEFAQETINKINELREDGVTSKYKGDGYLYNLNLDIENDSAVFDLDKPISEQHPDVIAKLDLDLDKNQNMTGRQWYSLQGKDIKATSDMMKSHGIVAMRYTDTMNGLIALEYSSTNHVILDTDIVTVKRVRGNGIDRSYSLSLNHSADVDRKLLPAEKQYYTLVREIKKSMIKNTRGKMTSDERRDLAVARQKAIDARKMERSVKSLENKIAVLVDQKIKQAITANENVEDIRSTIVELEKMIQQMPVELRGRFRGIGTIASLPTKESRRRALRVAQQRINNIINKNDYYKIRREARGKFRDWQKKIRKAKARKQSLNVTNGDVIEEYIESYSPLSSKEQSRLEAEVELLTQRLNDVFIQSSDPVEIAKIEEELEEKVVRLNKSSLFDSDVPLHVLQDFLQDLDSIVTTGKTEWQIRDKEKKAKRKEIADKIIEELGGEKGRPSVTKETETLLKKTLDIISHGGRPEAIAQIMFNRVHREDNTFIREILEPIFDAETVFETNYNTDLEFATEQLKGIDLDEEVTLTIGNDLEPITLPVNTLMAIYGYSQNESALNHLLNTTLETDSGSSAVIDETFIKKVESTLSDDAKTTVDNIIDYNDEAMYDRLNEVAKDKAGISMTKEDRYLPITNLKRNIDASKEIIQDNNIAIGINSGMTKSRVKSDLPFGKLNFDEIIAKGYHDANRQIAYAIPFNEVSRRLNHVEFVKDEDGKNTKQVAYSLQDELKNRSEIATKALNKWLTRQVDGRYNRGSLEILSAIRNNVTISLIGGNIKSLAFIPLAGLQSIGMSKNRLAFIGQLIQNVGLLRLKQNKEDASKLSPFIKARGNNININFQEIAERRALFELQGIKDKKGISKKGKAALHASQEFFMNWMTGVDRFITSTVFMSQYNVSMKEHGNVERAIKEAEQLVRTTQSTQSMAHSAELFASQNVLEKLMRSFTGDLNMNINNWAAMLSDGSKSKKERAASVFAMLVTQAVLVALINSRYEELEEAVKMGNFKLRENRDSKDNLMADIVVEGVNQMTGGLPVVSDVAESVVGGLVDHEHQFYAGTPNLVGFDTIGDFSKIMSNPKTGIDGALQLSGVPARKFWKPVLDWAWDELDLD